VRMEKTWVPILKVNVFRGKKMRQEEV